MGTQPWPGITRPIHNCVGYSSETFQFISDLQGTYQLAQTNMPLDAIGQIQPIRATKLNLGCLVKCLSSADCTALCAVIALNPPHIRSTGCDWPWHFPCQREISLNGMWPDPSIRPRTTSTMSLLICLVPRLMGTAKLAVSNGGGTVSIVEIQGYLTVEETSLFFRIKNCYKH